LTELMRSVLLGAGVLFALFLLLKMLRPATRRSPTQRQAAERLAALKQQATDPARSPAERAATLRSAAGIALDELGRPGLAASYARRADRLDPDQADTVGLLALALRRQARFAALERLLWRKLGEASAPSVMQRVREELVGLYDGPLRRPEVAAAFRRWS
jgi:hypothetical protein